MRVTLRQLEVFAVIARTENVSRAAERMVMSQSAASSALVDLENAFDCPLFDRIGKSLRLNATGRGLIAKVDTLLVQAADIESYLSGGQLGPLTLGATMTIGNYLAPLLIAEYMRQYPDAPVHLHVANTESIVDDLIRFNCDGALIESDVSHPDLLIEPWLEDELVIFCAPEHPLARQDHADNAMLVSQWWILRERGSGTRGLFDRIVASQLDTLMLRLELEHTEAIKRAVESGLGIGCLSRLSLREAFRRGSLVELNTPQFDLRRMFNYARHRQRRTSAATEAFFAISQAMTNGARTTQELSLPFIL